MSAFAVAEAGDVPYEDLVRAEEARVRAAASWAGDQVPAVVCTSSPTDAGPSSAVPPGMQHHKDDGDDHQPKPG